MRIIKRKIGHYRSNDSLKLTYWEFDSCINAHNFYGARIQLISGIENCISFISTNKHTIHIIPDIMFIKYNCNITISIFDEYTPHNLFLSETVYNTPEIILLCKLDYYEFN